ncbi:MAG: glycolate oxidase subunit GlcF [Proteobacteria bacterium]|nr:glycolate oxidase subunit GlcF [Pseudomonadota bacterium]
MQTQFSLAQLADDNVAEAERILRTCVHCGFCLATCPTYVLLGDELDSPRGRIYLIKGMLESQEAPTDTHVRHIDRCLSCLGCVTTCPSGVDYMHLVDQGRAHIERTYRRPWFERRLRALLAAVLPRPGLFRFALAGAVIVKALRAPLPGRLGALIRFTPRRLPRAAALKPRVYPAEGARRMRVALLTGCVQQVLDPAINAATIRLLRRLGCEVVVAGGMGCCGALTHHLGKTGATEAFVRANIAAWSREIEGGGLDAVVANASGCGTMLKDYGHVMRGDAQWAERAARISELAVDVSELIARLETPPPGKTPPKINDEARALTVAYHPACSLAHGQGLAEEPRLLLEAAGFTVRAIPESHLCCGSAGTYNILEPTLAVQLGERKAANIERTGADVIATGNIGCMVQLSNLLDRPVVHTVELLDWASGGPKPPALSLRVK